MNDSEIPNSNNYSIENDEDLTAFSAVDPNDKRRRLTKHQQQIAWRRNKIFTIMVQGVTNTYDLASVLHISQTTASRDVQFLKRQATEQLKFHIQERLPWEYRVCSQGIAEVLKYAWFIILQDDTRANKIATLSLIAQCYKDRLEIATNAAVVTDALRQVEKMKQQILDTDMTKVQSDNRS